MNVDGVSNGIVIDHISAGRSMEIYHFLHLEDVDSCVAIIKNVQSTKYGKKDIIKIDEIIDLDLDVLGIIDPGITVNYISNGEVAKRERISLPATIRGILKCKNPRCITTTEQGLTQEFRLCDEENKVYRCVYCETKADTSSLK